MKRTTIIIAIITLLLSLHQISLANTTSEANFDADALDAFVEREMRRHNLPGVAVAITQGDEIVYIKGFGMAAKGQAMTPDTPMFIGSLSKSFTALAIMQLHE